MTFLSISFKFYYFYFKMLKKFLVFCLKSCIVEMELWKVSLIRMYIIFISIHKSGFIYLIE